MKTLLHVGCGPSNITHLSKFFQDGSWSEIRYDINPDVNPDIIGTLQDMSLIEDGSIDAVYSSHNIEHVNFFEVPIVLNEFFRVLKPEGFAAILCPDIYSVAQAITDGFLTKPLYISPAGPISAIDIIYGFQADIAKGNSFMAHRTAFTADTLAVSVGAVGFSGSLVARDNLLGLHSISTKKEWGAAQIDEIVSAFFPGADSIIETQYFGCYEPEAEQGQG